MIGEMAGKGDFTMVISDNQNSRCGNEKSQL